MRLQVILPSTVDNFIKRPPKSGRICAHEVQRAWPLMYQVQ